MYTPMRTWIQVLLSICIVGVDLEQALGGKLISGNYLKKKEIPVWNFCEEKPNV